MAAEPAVAGTTELSFEAALAKLETIVRRLETGEAGLEDSIRLYEEGVALQRICEDKLAHAQARIEEIRLAADGTPGTQPFAS